MALLTVTAALAGWWLGASLPLDISDTTRQIAALLTASACTWILYIVSRKIVKYALCLVELFGNNLVSIVTISSYLTEYESSPMATGV